MSEGWRECEYCGVSLMTGQIHRCTKEYELTIDRLTAELTEWENHCEAMQHRAEQAEKRLAEISADWIVCNEKLIQAEKELANYKKWWKSEEDWYQLEKERDRYREALERIAEGHYALTGRICNNIAREALTEGGDE